MNTFFDKVTYDTIVYGVLDSTQTELCRGVIAPHLFSSRELAEAWCVNQGLPTGNVTPMTVMSSNEQ
jgi:hypothetical protein